MKARCCLVISWLQTDGEDTDGGTMSDLTGMCHINDHWSSTSKWVVAWDREGTCHLDHVGGFLKACDHRVQSCLHAGCWDVMNRITWIKLSQHCLPALPTGGAVEFFFDFRWVIQRFCIMDRQAPKISNSAGNVGQAGAGGVCGVDIGGGGGGEWCPRSL